MVGGEVGCEVGCVVGGVRLGVCAGWRGWVCGWGVRLGVWLGRNQCKLKLVPSSTTDSAIFTVQNISQDLHLIYIVVIIIQNGYFSQ